MGDASRLCGRADVAMVQPINLWDRDDTRRGRVLVEAQMRPRIHVLRNAVLHDALQSRGAQDDHVIKAFASNRSDEALDASVLPG